MSWGEQKRTEGKKREKKKREDNETIRRKQREDSVREERKPREGERKEQRRRRGDNTVGIQEIEMQRKVARRDKNRRARRNRATEQSSQTAGEVSTTTGFLSPGMLISFLRKN